MTPPYKGVANINYNLHTSNSYAQKRGTLTMDMFIKVGMLIVFFGTMIGTGLYCRKHSTDVDGFVLGGRSVGPWLTAFAFGTSYFSAVVFVGYAGSLAGNTASQPPGPASAMPSSDP